MSSSPATESLILPDAPPIPDLRFRHWQEADLEDMVRIFNAVADADQFDIKVTLDEIKTWYVPRPDFDPQRDIIVAHVADEMIAFCECGWYDNTDEIRFYSITGRVHPNWRRRGVGTALIRYNQQHARELAQTHPYDMPKKFVSYGADTAIGTQTILAKEGFTPVRYFYDMVCDLAQHQLDVALPTGIEVRPVSADQYRQVWDAFTEAMRDHWNAWEPTEDDYQQWLTDPTFEPSLWCVAWEGDQIVGQVLNFIKPAENEAFQRKRGYTENISVRRPWRKRGIARGLIALSQAKLREHGMTEAALRVDTENISGALRLYEDCGYKATKQVTHYHKPLEP